MKVFVNSRFLTQKITGTQRFAVEISKQLKRLAPDKFVFIAPKNIIHKEIAKEFDVRVVGIDTGSVWEQIDLPLYLKTKGTPLLLNLVNTAPIYYLNKVAVIHDIAWKHYFYSVSKSFYLWYGFLIPRLVKKAKFILTVSSFSKNDLVRGLNIKSEDIGVIYNSVFNRFKFLNLLKEKQILSVASLHPYKNLEGLIRAFVLLKDCGKISDYKLILVGGYNKKIFADTKLIELSQNRDDIYFTGYLPDDELVKYYNKASLFVYPSFFEGFGIPPIEAMACGCPCVVSNAASLPEVCGDAAHYVNPCDVVDIARGVEKVLNDQNLRQDLIKKGFENIKRFSWEDSAMKIIECINNLNIDCA